MPLDEADLKKLQEMFGTFKTGLTEEMDKKYATNDAVKQIVTQGLEGLDLTTKITEAVTEATKGLKPAGEPKKKEGEGGEVNPELLRLQEQMAEMERKSKAAEEARVAAERREAANTLRGAITESLSAAGVPPERHAQALAFLQTMKTDKGDPVLAIDDTGRRIWRQQKDNWVDTMNMADGLKAWTETDAGKLYLPPVGTQGTGEGRGNAPKTNGNAPRTKDGNLDWGAVGGRLSTSGLAAATGA